MATPEGKVKTWLDKMFKAEGVCYFAPQAGPYGGTGIEDRIAIVCGLYLGVEVKADASKKMTAKQEIRKKEVLAAGGTHFLVYDKPTIELVRQWIVSARSRRQEGGGRGVGGPTSDPRCHTNVEVYPWQAFPFNSTTHTRDDNSSEELRASSSEPHKPLL